MAATNKTRFSSTKRHPLLWGCLFVWLKDILFRSLGVIEELVGQFLKAPGIGILGIID